MVSRDQLRNFVVKLDESFDEPSDLVTSVAERFDKAKGAGTVDFAVAIHRNAPEELEKHVRLFVSLTKRLDVKVIAELVGCDVSELEKTARGRYAKDIELAKMINGTDDKSAYAIEDVYSYGIDYKAYAEEHYSDWDNQKSRVDDERTLEDLLDNIKSGLITKDNVIEARNLRAYANNRQKVDDFLFVYGTYHEKLKS